MTDTGNDQNRDHRVSQETTTEVIFVDAMDAVDELLSDPELAEESQAIRERMREVDRVHATGSVIQS